MKVLVTYATRHGSTRGIAERIASGLEIRLIQATVRPVEQVTDVASYDAYVIGSATYAFHWLDSARRFVRDNAELLRTRPVWLFSAGPLGEEGATGNTEGTTADAAPKEYAEFDSGLQPRSMRVFSGAYDPEAAPVGMMEKIMHAIPPARNAMPAGDFRNWQEIDAWAGQIADELQAAPVLAS